MSLILRLPPTSLLELSFAGFLAIFLDNYTKGINYIDTLTFFFNLHNSLTFATNIFCYSTIKNSGQSAETSWNRMKENCSDFIGARSFIKILKKVFCFSYPIYKRQICEIKAHFFSCISFK